LINPIPQDEAYRLALLASCAVLDTANEPAFDGITRLAQQLCGVPIAAISLVDADRQWFKSSVGLSVKETNRDVAFCAHAIMSPRPFIVNDATRDVRFSENPLVKGEPGIRFYAGVPLVLEAGSAVGSLCVIDTKPREFSGAQLDILKLLAAQAAALLQLAKSKREQEAISEQLVLARRQLKTILDTSSVGMFLATPSGECNYFNAAWEQIAGLSSAAARQGGWAPRLHPDDRARVVDGWICAVANRKQFEYEARFVHPDGRTVHVDASCCPMFEGEKLVGYIGTVVDMTAAREFHDSLHSLRNEVDEAIRFKRDSSGHTPHPALSMTHDLQSPLAASMGQLAIADSLLDASHAARPALVKAKRSLERMGEMLDTAMSLAQMDQEGLMIEPVRIDEIVLGVAGEMAAVAQQSGVYVQTALEPASVRADARAMERCVRNLLSNAIKFTAAHAGKKRVRAVVTQTDDLVQFRVEDTGPGVPAEMLTRVFTPFTRATDAAPGTGLGLSSVKRYVEAFHGRVWLENRETGGLVAMVELPSASSVRQGTSPEPLSSRRAA